MFQVSFYKKVVEGIMSRVGITFEEVAEAALSIEKNGETPTIDKIRAHLGGTGSNTTISKYLQVWRNKLIHGNPIKENKTPAPDIVQVAVDRVWYEMREQTDSEIESIKTEAQKLIIEAEKKTQEAESNFRKAQAELDQLQQTHLAQSAEKELLQLDIKKLNEEHCLLQERFKGLEERYAEMQAITSQHLNDLTEARQKEVQRLEEICQSQSEAHIKLVNTIKDQNEKGRQNHIVQIDNLKTENKKTNEKIQKLQTELQEKFVIIKKLETDLAIITAERDDILSQLAERDKRWSYFNDKTLISNDVLTKIYDAPKFDSLIEKINLIFENSVDKKFLELKEDIKFFDFSSFIKEKIKDKQDE